MTIFEELKNTYTTNIKVNEANFNSGIYNGRPWAKAAYITEDKKFIFIIVDNSALDEDDHGESVLILMTDGVIEHEFLFKEGRAYLCYKFESVESEDFGYTFNVVGGRDFGTILIRGYHDYKLYI